VVSRLEIEPYELLYAVAVKSLLLPSDTMVPLSDNENPFYTTAYVEPLIYDAEVVSRKDYPKNRRVFQTPPFPWQTTQSPSRYGGVSNSLPSHCH
jgi:hypothetical protein